MAYEEYPCTGLLARVVEFFWSYEADDRDLQRIPPDGRCEVIVHLGTPYLEAGEGGFFEQAPALFAGQLTRPLHLRGQGRIACISARIRPAAAATIAQGDMAAFSDRRADLATLDPLGAPALVEAVRAAPDQPSRIALLAAYVERRCRSAPFAIDGRVEQAVAALDAGEPPPAAALAEDIGISARHLQRQFRFHVGVPLKLYGSVIRFRKIFDALSNGARNLSDAAAAAGFSDHPQMARDFQRFVGCSASQFIRERAELAEAMTRGRPMAS